MNLINSPSQPPSSSMQHAASRHRDNLDDYRRDFLRTRVGLASVVRPEFDNAHLLQNNVEQAIARSNLLGSVRKDIKSVILPSTSLTSLH